MSMYVYKCSDSQAFLKMKLQKHCFFSICILLFLITMLLSFKCFYSYLDMRHNDFKNEQGINILALCGRGAGEELQQVG